MLTSIYSISISFLNHSLFVFIEDKAAIITAIMLKHLPNYTQSNTAPLFLMTFQATSKLLVNYPKKQQKEILDYLFKVSATEDIVSN